MKRMLISAAIGVGLACSVFWAVDLVERLNRAGQIATLQGELPSDWLALTDVSVANGHSRPGLMFEPAVTWTIEPKRLLEARVAVTTRNVDTGEPVCVGGSVTFILEPSAPLTTTRALSRIAGVDRCDWPVGSYRSRFVWSLTEPATRVTKSIVQESGVFEVVE